MSEPRPGRLNDTAWTSRLRYALTRFLKDVIAVFDRRPGITRLTEGLYLGGRLTPLREAWLRRENVSVIANLRDERSDALGDWDVHLWLPSRDGRPPSDFQLLLGTRFIESQIRRGRRVYAHCHAGVGRAPTLCALYLVRIGYSADEALRHIRRLRPRVSLSSRQREAIVRCAAKLDQARPLPSEGFTHD